MTTRELVDLSLCAAAVVVACVVFVRVSKDEIRAEDTATEEMRARGLSYYTQHLETTMPPAVTGRRHQESRIGDTAPTTNSNALSQG